MRERVAVPSVRVPRHRAGAGPGARDSARARTGAKERTRAKARTRENVEDKGWRGRVAGELRMITSRKAEAVGSCHGDAKLIKSICRRNLVDIIECKLVSQTRELSRNGPSRAKKRANRRQGWAGRGV